MNCWTGHSQIVRVPRYSVRDSHSVGGCGPDAVRAVVLECGAKVELCRAQDVRTVGLSCVRTRVPRGAMGCFTKSNAPPWRPAYAETELSGAYGRS